MLRQLAEVGPSLSTFADWSPRRNALAESVFAFGGTGHYACRRAGTGAISPYVHGQLEGCKRCWF